MRPLTPEERARMVVGILDHRYQWSALSEIKQKWSQQWAEAGDDLHAKLRRATKDKGRLEKLPDAALISEALQVQDANAATNEKRQAWAAEQTAREQAERAAITREAVSAAGRRAAKSPRRSDSRIRNESILCAELRRLLADPATARLSTPKLAKLLNAARQKQLGFSPLYSLESMKKKINKAFKQLSNGERSK